MSREAHVRFSEGVGVKLPRATRLRRLRRFGRRRRSSAAPCTSIATCSPTRPDHLHEEVSADYNYIIDANTRQEIEAKRKVFLRKWRLKCRAVADSLEEAGDRLFTFARFPQSQWKSIRTTPSNVCMRN